MKIRFGLGGITKEGKEKSFFRSPESLAQYRDYLGRITRFVPVESAGRITEPAQGLTWICDREKGKAVSSEELAKKLQTVMNSGVKELTIAIGGPDGFSRDEIKKLAPGFVWSFGPLTLPHELAAVLAAEQIYRAFTILHHHPYHRQH
ncbi:MAG: 23S rRNA (pseudouridine(1915)-N(3))-methyltransferase RlmH [Candidatus Omnitrophota bacterium]